MDSQRVKTPFENLEREKLQSWSKFAKEKGILDGYQRKVIYEAGKYNNIFLSRLSKFVPKDIDCILTLKLKLATLCFKMKLVMPIAGACLAMR